MRSGSRAGPGGIGADDRRFLEYLLMNWRISLLNAYLNGGFEKYEELARAINRCSIIMDVLRDESNPAPQSVLEEQLSMLASELGDIIGGEEADERGGP